MQAKTPLKIVSMVKIDGRWVNQDEVPAEKMRELVAQAMYRAGKRIGAEVHRGIRRPCEDQEGA